MSNVVPSAPGELELVRAFVNTREEESGKDALGSPEDLAAWLRERDLADGRATRADLRRAVEVREALRVLMLANNGEPTEPGAEEVLDAAARAAGLAVRFGPGGARLVADKGGAPGALGKILAIVAAAMADGTWSRMKACREGTCLWAFYDHSKNRSRTWCSMAVCGNRTKVKKYRRRKAPE